MHYGVVDLRTTSVVSSSISRGGSLESAIRYKSVLNAMFAISKQGWRTEVRGGLILAAMRTSSKPATMTSPGTDTPSFFKVFTSHPAAMAEKNSESAVPGIASPIVRFLCETNVPAPFRVATRPRRFSSATLLTALGRETPNRCIILVRLGNDHSSEYTPARISSRSAAAISL